VNEPWSFLHLEGRLEDTFIIKSPNTLEVVKTHRNMAIITSTILDRLTDFDRNWYALSWIY